MPIKIFENIKDFIDNYYFDRLKQIEVSGSVSEIINDVRMNGDKALLRYTMKFDGIKRKSVKADKDDFDEENKVSKEELDLFHQAYENIKHFHQQELKNISSWELKSSGILMGQRLVPVERAGLYVPGGTASYPSSVLMNVVPAMVAGVKEIVVVSPPDTRTGRLNKYVAAILDMLEIKEVYVVGGAHAIAALAFGTESIRPVDKITGPGNVYVAEAKRQVFGYVGIDSIAGPSEVVVMADDSANPEYIAIDMLSQAEHDPLSKAICVTIDNENAERICKSIDKFLQEIERKEIASRSITENGAIVKVKSLEEAIEIVNAIAPEHLELHLKDADSILHRIKNAGAVFIGDETPEPIGDYWAGTNHVLPTGRSARFSSGLSVRDYLKWINYLHCDRSRLAVDGEKIIKLAELEGLTAHAKAIKVRLMK